MANAAGLARLFKRTDQVTMSVKAKDGEWSVVTLNPAEVQTIIDALKTYVPPK